ncbi:WXG100 family type VII secretion target [Streptomyces yaizuensis]|uniref:ESAT-6-like protein n=1 Tax=Streptomyces yaizuensis TaxID=2989713 RepID=A0ABQ5P911_9ACTN|nr:WXG100 family type VII secretion target [Streptomyces sp. YSPA8]GLF99075.1 WXG100 family type VII secretion target [Streptomyces sp. YSPA8]
MSDSAGQLVVTYASLDQAAVTIEKQAAKLNEGLESLQSKLRSISDGFEGEAATAADAYHKQWDKETRMIHEALKGIARAVREAAPAYQAGDRKAAGYF